MTTQTTHQTPTSSPPIAVELAAGTEPLAELVGAVDAVLASDAEGISVSVVVSGERGDRAALAELFGADPRVSVREAGAPGPERPAEGIRVELPPSVRVAPRSLGDLRERMLAEDLGDVEAPASLAGGRLGSLLSRGPRLRATGPGSRSARIGPAQLDLGTSSAPPDRPPPKSGLAHERAEHLRHRARSATYRAEQDRNAQRFARERTEYQHQRARARLAERRLAATGPGEWTRWRGAQAAGAAAMLPRLAARPFRVARGQIRRVRRLTVDRIRRRRSAVAELPKAGQDDGR